MFSIKKVLVATLLMVGTVFAATSAMAYSYDVEITISNLDGAVNLAAFDIGVSYDDALLTLSSYTLTEELGLLDDIEASDWSTGDDGDGTFYVGVLSWLEDTDFFDAQADEIVLATLTFESATAVDLAGFSLSYIDLSDEYGDAISSIGTSISVNSVPEPCTMCLMGLGSAFLGVAGLRRRKYNLLNS